jgi:hypothetical protein
LPTTRVSVDLFPPAELSSIQESDVKPQFFSRQSAVEFCNGGEDCAKVIGFVEKAAFCDAGCGKAAQGDSDP